MDARRLGATASIIGSSLLFVISAQAQSVLYVDINATGPTHDGSSWCNAFTDLQEALGAAAYGDEIRVADGTYTPDGGSGDRLATFQLLNGVALRGGYAGCCADDPDERDIAAYEIILSGDLFGDDGSDFENNAENSYHVVTGSGTDETAIIDGFTITAGNADGVSCPHNLGAGMHNDTGGLTVSNCTFSGNSAHCGAGMYNSYSSLTVSNCTFSGNLADYGGGMHNSYSSDPMVSNCTFSGNLADYGGGMYNSYSSSPTVSNCTFTGNSARRSGGGMCNCGSPTVTNCTFSGNLANYGGGMKNCLDGDPTVSNCTFSGNLANYGGGMSNLSSSTVSNCTFTGNLAILGGGMSNDTGSLTVTNCTFSGNLANYGGGIRNNAASDLTITNCILWGNIDETGTGQSAQIHSFHIPFLEYCCVQGWTGSMGGIWNNGDNPLFIDADGLDGIPGTEDDNLRLSRDSPCINTGDPDFVPEPGATDLDGHARVLCDRVDRGAYEFGIGDYDCDRDVTLFDFASWTECMTGPDNDPILEGCEVFDFDSDEDVDLADYAEFQRAFTGVGP